MYITKTKLLLALGLCAALVVGCGGGGGDAGPLSAPLQGSAAVVEFITNLIAGSTESDDLIDVDAVTLALDDVAEPTAF